MSSNLSVQVFRKFDQVDNVAQYWHRRLSKNFLTAKINCFQWHLIQKSLFCWSWIFQINHYIISCNYETFRPLVAIPYWFYETIICRNTEGHNVGNVVNKQITNQSEQYKLPPAGFEPETSCGLLWCLPDWVNFTLPVKLGIVMKEHPQKCIVGHCQVVTYGSWWLFVWQMELKLLTWH